MWKVAHPERISAMLFDNCECRKPKLLDEAGLFAPPALDQTGNGLVPAYRTGPTSAYQTG